MPRAVVSARRDAGGGLALVALDVDEETARSYVAPGQYVEVRAPTENGYFVLGSGVGRSPLELLVRNNGAAADLLSSAPVGASIEISAPLGRGFPLAALRGRPLVLAVVASALGVARAALLARPPAYEATFTSVYVGVRAPADVPLADEVEHWTKGGVPVVLCLSRPEASEDRARIPGAARASGWVQTVLRRALAEGEIAPNALVAAAGPEGMLADLRTLATEPSFMVEVVTNTS